MKSKHTIPVITEVIALQCKAKEAQRQADELKAALRDLKTRRWRYVQNVRLREGKCYLIRRSWPDYDEPAALARWSERHGWSYLVGQMSHTTASICKTEVYG